MQNPPADGSTDEPETTLVVLDTAWTPGAHQADGGLVLLRDVVERIMRERDLIADTANALDDWAEASGIAGLMIHEGVSFWYGARLGHWMWLLDEILWLAVLDQLLVEHPGTGVLELDVGSDPSLVLAARQVAARDGLVAEGAATRIAADPANAVVASAPALDLDARRAKRTRPDWPGSCDGSARPRPSAAGGSWPRASRRSSAIRSAACSSSRPMRASGSRPPLDHA